MNFILGIVILFGCLLGGFTMMGGHVFVLWQPYEYVVILGAAVGTFMIGNTMKIVKEAGKAMVEAITESMPKPKDYVDVLALLFVLLRELKAKTKSEMEAHIDAPGESDIFKAYPTVLKNTELVTFICDYCRLVLIGSARPHEIESLMEEEIDTIMRDKLKVYQAVTTMSDALPALGIVAAVLGVIHAMGAIDQPPEILGELIGSALVGTFAGILFSYGVFGPISAKIKTVREKKVRIYMIVKQTIIAFMNGSMPQVAVEHGRKAVSAYERPTANELEQATIEAASKKAA
ncbi:flagellar motor stator protein MotA [Aestuariivirga litoralis]|uniref:flagellar motor stator protein MotA n=1 Tax=Aestuariivirga litoralis TaxID=2650924 RepID=UPI0018C59B65|nr:flagellar motor stator protein MotA [Aestuariivirga litoralis]MBG1233204.1 flagellar motor stator protein MotA [Aestuariivirga litoralis]